MSYGGGKGGGAEDMFGGFVLGSMLSTLMNGQNGMLNQQNGMLNEQNGMLNEQNGMLTGQSGMLNVQNGMLNGQSGDESKGKGKSKGQGKGKGKGWGENGEWVSKFPPKKRGFSEKLSMIDAGCKVWVGGFPKGVTWRDLQLHFESLTYKPIHSEVINKGPTKVFGICAFKTAEEAAQAIATVNGTLLMDSTLVVDFHTRPGATGESNSKQKLVAKLKQLQRVNPQAEAQWLAFTQSYNGIHDPEMQDKAVLEAFLTAFA